MERLRTRFGDDIGIVCCGPAGEMLYANSAVITNTPDFLPRSASRGGLGAVMGSKKLKAVVIADGDARLVEVANPQGVKNAATVLTGGIRADQIMGYLKDSGTAASGGMIAMARARLHTHPHQRRAPVASGAPTGHRFGVERWSS